MEIVEMKIGEVIPYDKNPVKHDDIKALKSSIEKFGFRIPIIIDKNNVIVCGHGRLMAAKKLKMKTVPCIYADDLTDEQIKAFRLADNKVAEFSEWDFDLLDEELNGILDIDMEEFGFDLDDQEEEKEAVEDDYEEKLPEEPRAKRGDIYQLGRHRLMCGDSTSLDDVSKLVGGCQMDMLITDQPYNVDYTGKTKDALKIKNDKMEDGSFRQFLRDAFTAADSVMKLGAVFYIWHADSEGYNFRGACKDIGWTVRQCIIWNKNSMVMGRQDYQWKHEPCLYGWKEGAGHLWSSDRKQTTVIDMNKPTKSELHPTMKPIGLFDYQIKNNTKGGDAVLDLFDGSGTTIMACEQNGRNAFAMELDPRYVDAAISRWEQFTGQKAVLLTEGGEQE